MKAIIIILCCILFACVLKAIEFFSNRKNINSVGARSNRNSKDIARININDEKELKEALKYYKDLAD